MIIDMNFLNYLNDTMQLFEKSFLLQVVTKSINSFR